jgi:soluble P-type ATPase
MVKRGIQIDIPGFRNLDIRVVCSDYTGTLSLEGELIHGVKKRLRKLAGLVDIYVLTSDTRGTAKIELQRIPLTPILLKVDSTMSRNATI